MGCSLAAATICACTHANAPAPRCPKYHLPQASAASTPPPAAPLRRVPVAIALHRCGEFRLKGVSELVGVAQALPVALEGRLPTFAPPSSLKVCWACFIVTRVVPQ